MDEEKILVLSEVSKFYTTAQNIVVGLQRITLSFSVGEFVAVTGESGSGKSTLAHILGGILPYESGEMFYRGKATSSFDGADLEEYRSSSRARPSLTTSRVPSPSRDLREKRRRRVRKKSSKRWISPPSPRGAPLFSPRDKNSDSPSPAPWQSRRKS